MIRRSNTFFRKKAMVILSFILFGSTLLLGIVSGSYLNNIKDKTESLQIYLEDETLAYALKQPDRGILVENQTHRTDIHVRPGELVAYSDEWSLSQNDVATISFANEKLEYLKTVQENTHKLESMVFIMLSLLLLLSFLLICALTTFSTKRQKRIAKRGGDVGGKIVRSGHHNDAFSKLVNVLHSKFKSVRH